MEKRRWCWRQKLHLHHQYH